MFCLDTRSLLEIGVFELYLKYIMNGLHMLPSRISYFEFGRVAVPKTTPTEAWRNSIHLVLGYRSLRMLLDLNIHWVSFA